jgi:hypothetical protein
MCPQCGEPFTGRPNQKFCKKNGGKCRRDYNNARRDAPRQEALSIQQGVCAYPTCSEAAHFFEPDSGVALCGVHHAGYWAYRRFKQSGLTELDALTKAQEREIAAEERGVVLGLTLRRTPYRKRLHVSIYDPALRETLRCLHDDIGQLIDHLSGECDKDGVPIPHPLDCRLGAA